MIIIAEIFFDDFLVLSSENENTLYISALHCIDLGAFVHLTKLIYGKQGAFGQAYLAC